MDFVGGASFLNIITGATETCTDVGVIDDDIAMEGNETFAVELLLPFILLPLDISTAEVTIIDDDSKTIYKWRNLFYEMKGDVGINVTS